MQKFQSNIQDQFGNEINGATITVRNVVGGALSTLFSDNASTPLANPFTAQDNSEFFFYAANLRYDVFITGPVTDSFLDIILFDPVSFSPADSSTFRTGQFLFDDDVTASDPAATSIKLNSATPSSVTRVRIALADVDGVLIADLTNLSLVGSRMRIWDEADPTQFQEYVLDEVPALDVDHFTFLCDFIAGTTSMPADATTLRVQFELTAYLSPGTTAGVNQNSSLQWNGNNWRPNDAILFNFNTPPTGGRIRLDGSSSADEDHATLFVDINNTETVFWYAEDSVDGGGFFMLADYTGATHNIQFHHSTTGNIFSMNANAQVVFPAAAKVFYGEKAAASSPIVGFGQFWVRNDTPNTPMFTDDANNDFDLTAGFAAPLVLLDNEQIRFGTGNDVQMDFDGTNFLMAGPAASVALVTGFDQFRFAMTLGLNEQATPDGDVAGVGQFWVQSEAPCVPMFTSDTGIDILIDPGISDLNLQNGNYEFVLLDKGRTVHKTSGGAGETYTIPAEASVAFRLGSIIEIENDGGGALTLAITTDTLINGDDNTTGSITIGNGGSVRIKKIASATWKANGSQMT